MKYVLVVDLNEAVFQNICFHKCSEEHECKCDYIMSCKSVVEFFICLLQIFVEDLRNLGPENYTSAEKHSSI